MNKRQRKKKEKKEHLQKRWGRVIYFGIKEPITIYLPTENTIRDLTIEEYEELTKEEGEQ